MYSDKEKLTLEKLMKRLAVYKSKKPNNSIESIGMIFTTIHNTYFFDSGTGKVFIIDKALEIFLLHLLFCDNTPAQLQDIADKNDLNLPEVMAYIEKEDLLKGTESNKLYCQEFIDMKEQERKSNCKQLILELTGACNLRCKYCIYSSSEKGFREFNSKKMKNETITKAIDYLRENGDDQVFISFYGGEPLIAFDSMKYAIDYATKNITEKELHFGFTTNLTLMTKEKAEYLVRIPNLHIVCSIDGPEEIHNMNRVYAGGEGTYRDVVRGLKFLKEALTQVEQPSVTINFNAVYMVPYKREKLEAIDMLLNEFCKITKNSTYIITYPTSGTIPKEYDALIPNNGDSSMWEWMADIARECENLEEIKARGIVDSLITVHNRTLTEVASGVIPMNACCIPGTRRLYIDTEGDMYVCERINKSPKIGNVNSGIDINTIMSKYYYEYSDKSIKYCANCWAAKMCPFCYADRMTESGISDNAHLHCAEARNHLKKQFSLYHEILENNPQKLEVLNKYEIK